MGVSGVEIYFFETVRDAMWDPAKGLDKRKIKAKKSLLFFCDILVACRHTELDKSV